MLFQRKTRPLAMLLRTPKCSFIFLCIILFFVYRYDFKSDLPNGILIDVTAFRSGRRDLTSESVNFEKVAIDPPAMQPFTVRLGTSRGDGFHKLVTTKRSIEIRETQLLTIEDMKMYLRDTEQERPLFQFNFRPWKVETAVRYDKACDVKQDKRWGMVFVVKSAVSNTDRRDAIRATWGNVKVYKGIMFETVFVLGQTADDEIIKTITQEHRKHGDILQYNLKDSAQLVPEKVVAGMQWASELPFTWFYMSIDDDISVNFVRLVSYFNNLIEDKHTFFNGTIDFSNVPIVCVYSYQDRDPPSRDPSSKWYMPKKDFPGNVWPVYCRGGAYATTSNMVKKLFQVSRRTARLHLDDVWITGFMRFKVENTSNNILAAPGSRLNDAAMYSDQWAHDSIVHHFWGNIANMKVDVVQSLLKVWNSIYKLIKDEVTCFGDF